MYGVGFRAQGLGVRVLGIGLSAWNAGLGFRGWRTWGLGLGSHGSLQDPIMGIVFVLYP